MLPSELINLSSTSEKKLFETAIIYFDASALLDLYFFSEKTLDEIFKKLLSNLSNRLYVTDQNWFEYNKNKNTVLLKPKASYQNLVTLNGNKKDNDGAHLEKINKSLIELKDKGFEIVNKQAEQFLLKTKKENRHPFIEQSLRDEFEKTIKESFDQFQVSIQSILDNFNETQIRLKTEISDKMDRIQERANKDNLANLLKEYFKVTNITYNFSKMLKIVEEGELRYRNKIPPGYEDEEEKEGIQIYGDLISWKQLLEHANSHKLPAILVSNDVKPDWVSEQRPRIELLKEYYDINNQQFWIFDLPTFIYKLELYGKKPLEASVKEEVDALDKFTIEKQNTFPKVSLEVIEDYLRSEYDNYEILYEAKNSLLCKCIDINDRKKFVHFEKATKSNYTSIINSMRRSLELAEKYGVDVGEYCLIHIAIGKNSAYQIINKHLTRAKARDLFEEYKDFLNLRLAWIDVYNGNLEFIDAENNINL
ncbi:PIN-like domain-containing protein [Brevibacillus sp. HD1.4A]|uniref:PIN-like domain-containing protein n=1 Tax=Brevibacillus sp. HD1.4A TaxID=2738978 RepID=UPI00156A949B|nr:PIN-like domain-containing protein [Brevibacillus sp. HD1.4A]NRQ56060.1 hypothetical protein [Brevibacillus sp. HD1.4A]